MASRIQVLLDYPFNEIRGEGWGGARKGGQLQFAIRDNAGKLQNIESPKNFWKVPSLSVVTLRPRLEKLGVVDYNDPESDAYKAAEVDVSADDDSPASLRLFEKTGTWARMRKTADSTIVGLAVSAAVTAILAQTSATLRPAWMSKSPLAANEGWAVSCQPVRTFDDARMDAYVAISFGGKYLLGIDLQGTATLQENLGTSTAPNWVERKRMDLGNGYISRSFTVKCIPVSGRYLVFRFEDTRYTSKASKLSVLSENQDFRFDCVQEGGGNYYDSILDQYVVSPPGKLALALNQADVDYRFQVFKIRYPADQVYFVRFSGFHLPNPIPGQTPVLVPYGFAHNEPAGAEAEEFTGGGLIGMTLEDEDGGTWTDESTKVCPRLSMAASIDGIYTPELYWIEARVNPDIYVPPYVAQDVGGSWTYIRFQRTNAMRKARCELKLNDEARVQSITRRGGPIRVNIDGIPVWDGYVQSRKPTVGLRFLETEVECFDMWDRLSVPCGHFEALDGKFVGDIISRLLRRAGFYAPQIEIVDNLQGLRVGAFFEPQSLKLYDYGVTIAEALRDMADKYCIQGVERLRIRWNGLKWRVYLAPIGDTGADPTTIFTSVKDIEPEGDDFDRWAAGYFRITSSLEWDIDLPEYNTLEMSIVTSGGDAGVRTTAFMPPRPEVLTDPTSQLFEGRKRILQVGVPESTATSEEELNRQCRAKYDYDQRRCVGMSIQGEYQPILDADQEIAVVGRHPVSLEIVSWGVFRIEEIDVEITQDDTPEDLGFSRTWEWSGAYRLLWLRPTSGEFDYPMYDGILPPPGFLTGTSRPVVDDE